MRALPADVGAATQRHLDAMDAAAPGLVRALYVTGSVTLGDYQPGRSDIDFMAFTSRPVRTADEAVLREVHASLPTPACYDGNYVGWHELPHVPDDGRRRPHIVDGVFSEDGADALTPSTWTEFTRYAVAVRGPAAGSLGITVRRERLDEWNLGNLNGYWSDLASLGAAILAGRDPAGLATAGAVVWCILGPPRLHFTLATGDITSKSGAGRYALEHFGAYEDVINAALTWRATGDGEFTNAIALRAVDLIRAIVADANQRWGTLETATPDIAERYAATPDIADVRDPRAQTALNAAKVLGSQDLSTSIRNRVDFAPSRRELAGDRAGPKAGATQAGCGSERPGCVRLERLVPAVAPGRLPCAPVDLPLALADRQDRAAPVGTAQVKQDQILAQLRPAHHPAERRLRSADRVPRRRDVAEFLILIRQLRALRLPVQSRSLQPGAEVTPVPRHVQRAANLMRARRDDGVTGRQQPGPSREDPPVTGRGARLDQQDGRRGRSRQVHQLLLLRPSQLAEHVGGHREVCWR
jgi:hypothetical protein